MAKLPEISQMLSFMDMIQEEKNDKAKLQKNFNNLQKQYNQLLKKFCASTAVPLKRPLVARGTQTIINTATVASQSEISDQNNQSVQTIEVLNDFDTWHHSIGPYERVRLVGKIVQAIFPSPSPTALLDPRMNMLISYAKQIEGRTFDIAKSKAEYYQILAEKIHDIHGMICMRKTQKKPESSLTADGDDNSDQPNQSKDEGENLTFENNKTDEFLIDFENNDQSNVSTQCDISRCPSASLQQQNMDSNMPQNDVPNQTKNIHSKHKLSEPDLHTNSTLSLSMVKRRKVSDMKCDDCGYTTTHVGHFKVHQREGCISSAISKDWNCQVCCQPFTYNQLRYHYRQYCIDSSKATNGHSSFSPTEHKNMLARLIANRKLEKQEQKLATK